MMQHPAALEVTASPVVHVYTVIKDESKRDMIYDLESKLIKKFSHLSFDFRVTNPLTDQEKDTLKRGGFDLDERNKNDQITHRQRPARRARHPILYQEDDCKWNYAQIDLEGHEGESATIHLQHMPVKSIHKLADEIKRIAFSLEKKAVK